MFELLGICLALAAVLATGALAAMLTSSLWRVFRARAEDWPAESRARLIFALRVFPAVIAVICAGALLLPAYIAHEPRRAVEPVSLKLGVLAVISAAGLLLALWRGVAAWVATRRLVKDWLRVAEPVEFDQIRIPAYRLRHQFPVIAIVGAIRPKLFVADHLFLSLTREEMAAAIAHESGHLVARDNLKRAALRACRDSLTIFPCGVSLDRAWASASESAADEHAANGGGTVALDLASALVKIARLVPKGVKPTMPASALLIGDADGIAQRVRRLARLATLDNVSSGGSVFASKAWPRACFAAMLISAILLMNSPSTLLAIHHAIEFVVSKLQ